MVAFLEKSTEVKGSSSLDFSKSIVTFAIHSQRSQMFISLLSNNFGGLLKLLTDDNGEVQITTTIDGITSIPNSEIFEQLALMGYHTDSDKLTFQKVDIGKGLLGPNGGSGGKFEGGGGKVEGGGGNVGSCGGNGRRGGSMAGRGGVGAGGGEVKGGRVDFVVSKSLLGDNPGVVIGESGGDTFGVDGGAVWHTTDVARKKPMDLEHGSERMKSPEKIEEEDVDTQKC
ncbi:hypothetical protein Tco_0670963 [Tanacetum coccineum]